MTETSTAYPEIEASIIDTYANRVSGEVRANIYAEIEKFFPESYDNPLGSVSDVVVGAIQVIEREVWVASQELAKRKLHRKLREGMEALLYAE